MKQVAANAKIAHTSIWVILGFVANTVAGWVVGYIANFATNDVRDTTLSAAIFIALAILALVISIWIFVQSAYHSDDTTNITTITESIGALAEGSHDLKMAIQAQLTEMEKNLHVTSVRYVATDVTREHIFKELTREIEKASESILVVNYFTGKNNQDLANEAISEKGQNARALYYQALIQRKAGANGRAPIRYDRVIQVENPADDQPVYQTVTNPAYNAHFHAMLDNGCTPRVVGIIRPMTFTIIDGKTVLLEIDKLETKNGATRADMHGIFIIHDPSGQIAQSFGGLFMDPSLPGRLLKHEDLIPKADLE